jgi:Transcriptional activator TraM
MLVAFEEALRKNDALWVESAKSLANQSLNASLRAARESSAALIEEAGRSQAKALRIAGQEIIERVEHAMTRMGRIAWVTLAASVIALLAASAVLWGRLFH